MNVFLLLLLFLSSSADRSVTAENIHELYTDGQEVEVRIMEVNTGNNKMSLSMLPPTEEAGKPTSLHPWSASVCARMPLVVSDA